MRDATEFGPICPQQGSLVDPALSDANVTGSVRYLPQSEDCLVLNVWTPGLRDGRRRPVMVWLHGRGFMAGAGSEPWYDGTKLARRGDAVIITINHRLNAFGYLHLTDALGEEFSGPESPACSTQCSRSSGCATTPRRSAAIRAT